MGGMGDYLNQINPFSSDEEKQPAAKYSDACFLMDYIDVLAAKGVEKNAQGWENFKAVTADKSSGGGAHAIISALTNRGGLEEFLDISPAAASLLQPKVRIYKLIYEDLKSPAQTHELIFDDYFSRDNIDALLGGNAKRVGGAGLKEIGWKFAGTNPAEADKIIEVSMKFEFQCAADLLGTRYNPADGTINNNPISQDTANFIDLILHPPEQSEAFGVKASAAKEGGKYVPKFYRIKVVVGWAYPEGDLPGISVTRSQKLKDELRRLQQSMYLNLVSHSFDIQENGGISLSVEYIGALEEAINGNEANILSGIADGEGMDTAAEAQQTVEEQRQRIAELDEYSECLNLANPPRSSEAEALGGQTGEIQEGIKAEEEVINEMTAGAKSEVYQKFLTELQSSVYAFDIDEDSIAEWLKSVSTPVRPNFSNIISGEIELSAPDNSDDAVETIETAVEGGGEAEEISDVIDASKDSAVDPTKGRVHYLYFGDIIDVACKMMNKDKNSSIDRMRILLGPIVITHPRGAKQLHFNMADLPISYEDFQAFFFETVIRKQLASYPLRQFLKDVIQRLVRKVLQPSECFPANKEQRAIKISVNNFTVSSDVVQQAALDQKGRFNVSDVPMAAASNVGTPDNDDGELNCMLYYLNSYRAGDLRAMPDGDGGGNFNDRAKGIYHFYIGAEAGLIKAIEYSRSDVQGLREARQAEARNLGQIRDVYNASVKLIGNSLFIPGMKVFLNPPIGFGAPEADGYNPNSTPGTPSNFGSISNLLGIGGYYDVITVDSTISRGGQYETTLECVFAQSGGKLDNMAARCESTLEKYENDPDVDDGSSVQGAVNDFFFGAE